MSGCKTTIASGQKQTYGNLRDLVFGVISEPEELMALAAGEVFGFGEERRGLSQGILIFKFDAEGVYLAFIGSFTGFSLSSDHLVTLFAMYLRIRSRAWPSRMICS